MITQQELLPIWQIYLCQKLIMLFGKDLEFGIHYRNLVALPQQEVKEQQILLQIQVLIFFIIPC